MKLTRLASLVPWYAFGAMLHAQYTVLNHANLPQSPSPVMTQTRDGSLISTGITGSSPVRSSGGWAYRYSTSGALTYLHHFPLSQTNYNYFLNPSGGVALGLNGKFYGMTEYGGNYNAGTIFEMTPAGSVSILHVFTGGQNGGIPLNSLLLSMSGDLYGTTQGSNSAQSSAILYRVTTDGNFTVLHVFDASDGSAGPSPLMQATDQWIYGTTGAGGTHGFGTIVRINRSGEYQTVYNFDGKHGSAPNGRLLQANDGNFYGSTVSGGIGPYGGNGVIYKMTPSHQVTVIHTFANGIDGAYPYSLMLASDGNLYGYAPRYDVNGIGAPIMFRLSSGGAFSVLHVFHSGNTAPADVPVALMQHTDGRLYGDTANQTSSMDAASAWYGELFSFDLGLSPFITWLASYGRVGTQVDILGENFTPGSQVYFNGVRALVNSQTSTYITAIIPRGATTGWITVTTGKGTLRSDKKFFIRR